MSLIRVRRERRAHGFGFKRPPSLVKLIAVLIIVAGLIWYLGQFS